MPHLGYQIVAKKKGRSFIVSDQTTVHVGMTVINQEPIHFPMESGFAMEENGEKISAPHQEAPRNHQVIQEQMSTGIARLQARLVVHLGANMSCVLHPIHA